MPVWTALLAWPVLGERPDRWTGGVCLASPSAASRFSACRYCGTEALAIGLLWALLGGTSWAAGTVVTKRWPADAPAVTVAAWQLAIGAAAGVGMLVFVGPARFGRLAPIAIAALTCLH